MKVSSLGTAILLFAGLLLSACASGPTASESPEAQRAAAAGKTRIVIYRSSVIGAGVQPAVKVDGRKTGSCQPNGVFFVDVKPGKHEVSASTEVTKTIIVDTRKKRTVYVECSIGIGVLVGRPHLTVVSSSTGKRKIGDLAFGGTY